MLDRGLTGLARPGFPRGSLAAWLLGLRWVAVLVLFWVVLFATIVAERVPERAGLALWLLWGVLAAFNGLLSLLGAKRLASQKALALQTAGDVLILGALLHFAGGMHNPFAGLFVFHAVIGSVVLDRRTALRTAGGIVAFIIVLTVLEATGAAPPGCLLDATGACHEAGDWLTVTASGIGVAVLVVGCALFVVALVSRLQADRDELVTTSSDLAAEARRLTEVRNEVLAEQEKLRSIVDCMTDAVIFAAPDGRILMRNRAAAELFASQPGASQDLHVCHEPQTWDRLMGKLVDPGPSETHPVLQIEDRLYEATYARVDRPDGERLGAVMLARDITDRAQEQATRMQKERMATVGKIAASLAHEINNPLSAIALFTQHAMKTLEPGSRLADHLGTVLRNADLCKKIVRDLLEYARQRPPEQRRFVLDDLVGDVSRTLAPSCERRRIELRTVVERTAGTEAHGDPVQLRQLLVNLGLNAVDAMGEGGVLVFRLSGGNGMLEIAVEDTGPGIPPEDRDKIFSAFFTTKPEGTGLGLAVARDIAAGHGGNLVFDESYTAGSRFLLQIPRRRRPRAPFGPAARA